MRVGAGLLVVAVLLFLWPAIGLANYPPVTTGVVPIEGTLVVESGDVLSTDPLLACTLQGNSGSILPVPAPLTGYGLIRPSPLQDAVVAFYATGYTPGGYPTGGDVYTASPDGATLASLTGATGLGGVNCNGVFSPDGTRILFNHFGYTPGLRPCDSGEGGTYVINADGSGLHLVDLSAVTGVSWSGVSGWTSDGRILVRAMRPGWDWVNFAIDPDGNGNNTQYSYGGFLSRDQLWVVYKSEIWTDTDYTKLVTMERTDGSETREIARWTLSFDDMQAVYQAQQQYADQLFATPEDAWSSILSDYGVVPRIWSPGGGPHLMQGVAQYDPQGAFWENQTELYVYDVAADELTQITDNDTYDLSPSWEGFNTFSDDPAVTVNNTTVTFDDIADEGLTNILVNSSPPALPPGEGGIGFVYEIKTTCTPSGTITVEMTYLDEDVPSGTAEASLSIYHYDTDASTWEDITVSRDLVNNVITGVTDSLSPFAMTQDQRFADVGFSHWAHGYILACVNAGIVGGYGDNYRPSLPVTRDQMAVFISRALAGGDAAVPTGPPTATFTDVPTDHWAYKYVEYAVDHGVVGGYGPGIYRPTLTVTRDSMAVFVARAMCGGDSFVPSGPPAASFTDVPTDSWAFRYVEYCKDQGVVGGYGPGIYRPLLAVTRDQMAVYVQRAFDLPM